LRDRDPAYRVDALQALGLIGQEDQRVIPVIVRSLKDRDGKVQVTAKNALIGIGKEAVPALIASLKDKEGRNPAIDTLSKIGAPSVPALVEGLKDKDPAV